MKFCLLMDKISIPPLYHGDEYSLFLYYISNQEYKKQILKGNAMEDPTGIIPILIVRYAMHTLRGRFLQGEQVIISDIRCIYTYAQYAIRGRFEFGESILSTDAQYSHLYACNILNERFILGEEVIKQSEYRRDYEKLFNIKL